MKNSCYEMKKYKKLFYKLAALLMCIFLFFYGVGVGHYNWFPSEILKRAMTYIHKPEQMFFGAYGTLVKDL
ncbi:hypothetical protein N8348_05140, partial [Litorivicinus sp.]|nr:hypothetical protein [Litorivicinus sp.]